MSGGVTEVIDFQAGISMYLQGFYLNGRDNDNTAFRDVLSCSLPMPLIHMNTHHQVSQSVQSVLHMIGSILRHRKEVFSNGFRACVRHY